MTSTQKQFSFIKVWFTEIEKEDRKKSSLLINDRGI